MVEIRTVTAHWMRADQLTGKCHEETFCQTEMNCVLFSVMVTWLETFVKVR